MFNVIVIARMYRKNENGDKTVMPVLSVQLAMAKKRKKL